jgi:fructose-1,6-bisphosphatase/sedoheptulose 1,7-bisphosphatase-like protein
MNIGIRLFIQVPFALGAAAGVLALAAIRARARGIQGRLHGRGERNRHHDRG